LPPQYSNATKDVVHYHALTLSIIQTRTLQRSSIVSPVWLLRNWLISFVFVYESNFRDFFRFSSNNKFVWFLLSQSLLPAAVTTITVDSCHVCYIIDITINCIYYTGHPINKLYPFSAGFHSTKKSEIYVLYRIYSWVPAAVSIVSLPPALRGCYSRYTPPTRRNCRVESRRRCEL